MAATVNREGIKPRTGVITPHEMVEELQSGFTVPSDDDFDGVDVTYINGTTRRRRPLNAGRLIIPRR